MDIENIINPQEPRPRASSAEDGTTGTTSTSSATSSAPTIPGMGAQSSCHDSPTATTDYSNEARLILPPSHSPSKCVDPAVRPEQAEAAEVMSTTDARAHGLKRPASGNDPAGSLPDKKQYKWSTEEDRLLTVLRGNDMKWEDISKHLPGRSAISCRLRFQKYLEHPVWDDEKKNRLARLYERFRKDMWEKIAKEMQIPWRAAENMHWQMGEIDIAQRANVHVFPPCWTAVVE